MTKIKKAVPKGGQGVEQVELSYIGNGNIVAILFPGIYPRGMKKNMATNILYSIVHRNLIFNHLQ